MGFETCKLGKNPAFHRKKFVNKGNKNLKDFVCGGEQEIKMWGPFFEGKITNQNLGDLLYWRNHEIKI